MYKYLGVLAVLITVGEVAVAEDATIDVFDAHVTYVTELQASGGRVIEIECTGCPERQNLAMRLVGPDTPKPVSGQPVQIYCRIEDGVMRIVSVDWRPGAM